MYEILIAEDETIIRKGLIKIITEMDICFGKIYEASNGLEAADIIKRYKPSIVITDIRMPIKDGLDFISEVRNNHHDIRFIIISGYSEFSYAQKAISYNVTEYLLKPIKKDKLYNALIKAIEQLRTTNINKYKNNTYSHSINCAISYIVENFNQNISLTEVANYLDLNPSYLSSIFKKETGMGFTEYLHQIRIEKAKQLLSQPYLKIYEISQKVGFTDDKYFYKIFKELTGLTPSKYRDIYL